MARVTIDADAILNRARPLARQQAHEIQPYALQRIEAGTYGQCLIDGGPIDPKRLDAVPWTPYCIRHGKLLEAASRPNPAL
jgi:RNA polymerase-binding transcription factor DksA